MKPTAKQIREAKADVERARAAWEEADRSADEAQRVLDARRRAAGELDALHVKAKQRLKVLMLPSTQLAAMAALRDGKRARGLSDKVMASLQALGLVTCEFGFRGRRWMKELTPDGLALLKERGL